MKKSQVVREYLEDLTIKQKTCSDEAEELPHAFCEIFFWMPPSYSSEISMYESELLSIRYIRKTLNLIKSNRYHGSLHE